MALFEEMNQAESVIWAFGFFVLEAGLFELERNWSDSPARDKRANLPMVHIITSLTLERQLC